MKGLKQLISEKEKELQSLEDSLGLGFPIIEQAKTTRICYLKTELEDLRELEGQIKLNDNQKIVLEWLKWSVKEQGNSVIDAVFLLRTGEALDSVLLELNSLNNQQQAEVLAAFAQWGLNLEEKE
ncbi:hypothetical protein NXK88_002235 [Enterococcus hirae]|uniref:hypothetical protein n=1 Tax=Enterococcus hirae TaxID=1354 RepID=UPI0020744010|nr:hypothetical protein [Enterococcus hirae]EMF0202996.1 hypothetical protein [Enterococcus hirae]